ncbi:hypothetical protein PAXRUDRAFT_584706 [Paxillus rubicundulus Ve08.2h10]|uniref:Uncharacterized protein n=1 Tax=Paxillus rubicundulus Ve08.2h10 TaxID=930991 RepID=A0A0D0DZ98_9AGAM|nr:hypothetical protein PAXRUDRAFT_584706 [Paxillus rubicundulus Ve08.2h10]
MQRLRETFFGSPSLGYGNNCCYDNQYRPTFHGEEQRYVSPSTGRCRPLVVQAVNPAEDKRRLEIPVDENSPKARKLAVWLTLHPPVTADVFLVWFLRWAWFTLALIWPFDTPKYTGFYPAYLSRYYGQLWAARSPTEYALRTAQVGDESVYEITHALHPRRIKIYNAGSESWEICSDPHRIRHQRYVAISYRYKDIISGMVDDTERHRLEGEFVVKVETVMHSLGETAYWLDFEMIYGPVDEKNKDIYRMADVYRGAQFTLIMLSPAEGVSEEMAWREYGERLWTLPEVLLSREVRFKMRDGDVTPLTLHQLANRAYANYHEESAIVNAYGLRDPLERLERLLMLKSALWRRKSGDSKPPQESRRVSRTNQQSPPRYEAEKVYALMGFFEHRIHPQAGETELQAFVRLSMANDNDRIVERMVSLLPLEIHPHAFWYSEGDAWGTKLWDVETDIQVVGMTQGHALVLGGCRAASIRWKDFPNVAFATRPSYKRMIANYLPNIFWELLAIGIYLLSVEASLHNKTGSNTQSPGAVALLVISLVLMLFAPFLVSYGTSGRIVQAQPWLVGVKGLLSAEEVSELMYGGAVFALPRTFYTPSGTLLSQTEKGQFRRGDPNQLEDLKGQVVRTADGDLYTLIDTLSATIYYFRAARPPTVCLYTGRESGMGRFVLCSEKCTINELHKETVIRMPWHVSQSMRACDWVALN